MKTRAIYCVVGLLLSARALEARVVRLVVEKTTPFAKGQSYGNAGPFEQKGNCEHLTSGVTTSKAPVQRALLVALDEWADKGTAAAAESVSRHRERDAGHGRGFVKAVEAATRSMIKDRFLLEEDAQKMIAIAQQSAILR